MRARNIQVKVSILRIILTLVIMFSLLYNKINIAIGIFIITALVSFGDNLITRLKRRRSLIKSIVGYLSDRILVDITALMLVIKGMFPFWVFAVFIARDFFTIIIGSILIYRDYRREFKPTALGRVNLLFQIITVLTAMTIGVDLVLIWITVVLTLASGVEALFKSEFKLIKRKTDIHDFRIFSNLKFADTFTFLNVIFGLLAIIFSIRGWNSTSAVMLILAVISDYFDGKIAKVMGQSNEFGKELDSLADTISFGVAPAIFGFNMIQSPLAVIGFTIFLFCGILRLARYNIVNAKTEFQGMPITLNGIIIPIIFFADVPVKFYPYIYLVLGTLMISNLRIKRLF